MKDAVHLDARGVSFASLTTGGYWRADADGNWTWGETSRPVPQWTRPGAGPVDTLGRIGDPH